MSDLLPSFTYPPGDGTGESYVYNYIDIVNVSWSWDGPPGAMIFIVLWLPDSGGTLRDSMSKRGPSNAYYPLSFTKMSVNQSRTLPFPRPQIAPFLRPLISTASSTRQPVTSPFMPTSRMVQ